MKKRVHGAVSGRVQGVFFRATTRDRARELGLSGWVRNLPGGQVEFVAEGDEKALHELLAFLRVGPPGARVDELEVEWSDPQGEEGFYIRG